MKAWWPNDFFLFTIYKYLSLTILSWRLTFFLVYKFYISFPDNFILTSVTGWVFFYKFYISPPDNFILTSVTGWRFFVFTNFTYLPQTILSWLANVNIHFMCNRSYKVFCINNSYNPNANCLNLFRDCWRLSYQMHYTERISFFRIYLQTN